MAPGSLIFCLFFSISDQPFVVNRDFFFFSFYVEWHEIASHERNCRICVVNTIMCAIIRFQLRVRFGVEIWLNLLTSVVNSKDLDPILSNFAQCSD